MGIGRTGKGGVVANWVMQEGMNSKSCTSAIMHKKYSDLAMILISERR